MAIEVSELWNELRRLPGTHKEYRFLINGHEYSEELENYTTHSVDSGLFEEFSAGNASCAQLSLTLYTNDDIPKGAKITREVRLVNEGRTSEWIPAGVYRINRRKMDDDYWTIEAYDNMRLCEQPWNPPQDMEFPCPETTAVAHMMSVIGCELDASIKIDYPTTDPDNPEPVDNNYTIRQELAWIAAGHMGNWIVTAEGKFLLVPLGSEPEETYLIVDEYGDYITFGGVRIVWN